MSYSAVAHGDSLANAPAGDATATTTPDTTTSIDAEFPFLSSAATSRAETDAEGSHPVSIQQTFDGGLAMTVANPGAAPAGSMQWARPFYPSIVTSSTQANGAISFTFSTPVGDQSISATLNRPVASSDSISANQELLPYPGGEEFVALGGESVEQAVILKGAAAQSTQTESWTISVPEGFLTSFVGGVLRINDQNGREYMHMEPPVAVDQHGSFAPVLENFDSQTGVLSLTYDPNGISAGLSGDVAIDPGWSTTSGYETGDYQRSFCNSGYTNAIAWGCFVTTATAEPVGWTPVYSGGGTSAMWNVSANSSSGLFVGANAGVAIPSGGAGSNEYDAPSNNTIREFNVAGYLSNNASLTFACRMSTTNDLTENWKTATGGFQQIYDSGPPPATHATWGKINMKNNSASSFTPSGSSNQCLTSQTSDFVSVTLVDTSTPSTPTLTTPTSAWYGPNVPLRLGYSSTDLGSGSFSIEPNFNSSGTDDTTIYICNQVDGALDGGRGQNGSETPCKTGSQSGVLTIPVSSSKGLTDGSNTVRARVTDYGGNISAYASTVSFHFDGTAPVAPSSIATLSPTPTNGTASVGDADGTVGLQWSGTAFSDASSGIDHYEVCIAATSQGTTGICGSTWQPTESSSEGTTSAYVAQVPPQTGSTYYWKVRAVDAAGNVGADSPEASFSVDAIAPTLTMSAPSGAVSQRASGQITYTGTVSDASGIASVHVQYRSFGSAPTCSGGLVAPCWNDLGTASLTGTLPCTSACTWTLTCEVPACSTGSDGLWEIRAIATDDATIQPNVTALQPTSICRDTASLTEPSWVDHQFIDSTHARIWWASVSGVSGYIVERQPSGGSWAVAARIPAGITTATDGQISGTGYAYRVESIGQDCTTVAAGNGTASTLQVSGDPGASPITSYPQIGTEPYWTTQDGDLGAGTSASINAAGGNLAVTKALRPNPGQGLSTNLTFTYNSQNVNPPTSDLAINGMIGSNWTLGLADVAPSQGINTFTGISLEPAVISSTASTIQLRDDDGTPHVFNVCTTASDACPSGSFAGKYIPPVGEHLRVRDWSLASDPTPPSFGGITPQYIATRPDNVSFYYVGYNASSPTESDGRLLGITDRAGNTLTISYECVAVDDITRVVTVPGRTSCVGYTPPSGSVGRYRPTAITDQGGRTVSLAYFHETSGSTFNRDGRLKSITDHGGVRTDIGYDRTSATATDPAPRLTTITEAANDGGAWTASTTYHAGQCVQKSSPDGNYFRIVSGGAGGTTEPTWPTTIGATVTTGGVTYRKVSAYVSPRTTTYVYPVTTALDDPSTVVEDESMRLLGVQDPRGNTTAFAYVVPDHQQLPRVNRMVNRADNAQSNGSHMRFAYGTSSGVLTGTTTMFDELDHMTTYQWNVATDRTNGRVTRIVDPNGVTTRFDFNARNDQTARSEIAPRITDEAVTLSATTATAVAASPFDATQPIVVRSAVGGGGTLYTQGADYTVATDVADEAITLTGTSPSNLATSPVDVDQPIVVRSATSDGGVLYREGIDYFVVSRNPAQIQRISTGSITSGQTVYATYRPASRITRTSGSAITSGQTVYVSYTPIHATWTTESDAKTGLLGDGWDPGETATTTTYTNNTALDGYVADKLAVTTPRGTATTSNQADFQTSFTYNSVGMVASIASPINAGSGSSADTSTSNFTYDSSAHYQLLTSADGNANVTGYGSYDANGMPGKIYYRCTSFTGSCTKVTSSTFTTAPAAVNVVRDDYGQALCVDDRRESPSDTGTACAPARGVPAFQTSHSYTLGDIIQPTSWNGHEYQATKSGTSSTVEPVWPLASGGTVVSAGTSFQEVLTDQTFSDSEYDAMGEAVRSTSPWTATTRRAQLTTYDANGNAVSTLGSIGYTIGSTTPESPDSATPGATSVAVYNQLDAPRATCLPANATGMSDPTTTTCADGTAARIATTVYDAAGQPIAQTKPQGNATTTGYDYETRNTYDAGGRLLGELDGENRLTCHFYDAYNNETVTSLPLAMDTTICPSSSASLDHVGYVTSKTFDKNHRATTSTDERGKTTSMTYDADGNVLSTTDPNGNETDMTYTGDDQQLTSQAPAMSVCAASGNPSQSACGSTVSVRPTSTNIYDANDNVVEQIGSRRAEATPSTFAPSTSYSTGDIVKPTVDNGHYYFVSSTTGTHTSGPTEPSWPITESGTVVSGTAPNTVTFTELTNNTTFFSYDVYDRQVSEYLPREVGNTSVEHALRSYNAMGELAGTTLQTTQTSYSSVPTSELTTYAYFPDGAIQSKADLPNDDSVSYTTDVNGQNGTRTEHGQTLTYSYWPDGSAKSDSSPAVAALTWFANYSYQVGQCVTKTSDHTTFLVTHAGVSDGSEPTWPTTDGSSVTDPVGGPTFTKGDCSISSTYDASGNVSAITLAWGDALTYNRRDRAGEPLQETGFDGLATTFAYDKNSNVTSSTIDGITTTNTYGTSGATTDQLTGVSMTQGAGLPTASASFTYDDSGNLATVVRGSSSALTTTYSYDSNNDTTDIKTLDASSHTFQDERSTFDLNANVRVDDTTLRLGATAAFQTSHAYAVGALVEPVTPNGHLYKVTTAGTSGASSPTWNTADASTTTSGAAVFTEQSQTASYIFDGQNRLRKDTLPGAHQRGYVYDSMGRLSAVNDITCSSNPIDSYSYESSAANVNQMTTIVQHAYSGCTAAGTNTVTYSYGDDSAGKPRGSIWKVADPANGTTTYTHDALNREVGSVLGDNTETVAYDGLSRRSRDSESSPGISLGSTLTYLYQGDDQASSGEDDSGTSNVESRGQLHDPNGNLVAELRDDQVRYVMTDHLGSEVQTVDASGLIQSTDCYDSAGAQGSCATTSGTTDERAKNTYTFGGNKQDVVTKDLNIGARSYDPGARVWLQSDQYLDPKEDQQLSLDPANQNRNQYAAGDPVDNTDPTGHIISCDGCSIAIIAVTGQKLRRTVWRPSYSRCLSCDHRAVRAFNQSEDRRYAAQQATRARWCQNPRSTCYRIAHGLVQAQMRKDALRRARRRARRRHTYCENHGCPQLAFAIPGEEYGDTGGGAGPGGGMASGGATPGDFADPAPTPTPADVANTYSWMNLPEIPYLNPGTTPTAASPVYPLQSGDSEIVSSQTSAWLTFLAIQAARPPRGPL